MKLIDEDIMTTGSHCFTCHNKVSYSERYDSFYCGTCNKWLESACESDCDCYKYFGGRPDKPKEN